MRLCATLALSSDEQAEIYRRLDIDASFDNPWRRSMGPLRRHDPAPRATATMPPLHNPKRSL